MTNLFKPTLGKILLVACLIIVIIMYFLSWGGGPKILTYLIGYFLLSPAFAAYEIAKALINDEIATVVGIVLGILYIYFLACVCCGLLSSIRKRENLKNSMIGLITLIILAVGINLLANQFQTQKVNSYKKNHGIVPNINKQSTCESKGFMWIEPTKDCYITSKEKCEGSGYKWNPCASESMDANWNGTEFIRTKVCRGSCQID